MKNLGKSYRDIHLLNRDQTNAKKYNLKTKTIDEWNNQIEN